MDERLTPPGWFLRPENWAYQMPQPLLGASPMWPAPNQSIPPEIPNPSSISLDEEHPAPKLPDQPSIGTLRAEPQARPRVPTLDPPYDNLAISDPPEQAKDFRTLLAEALSDRNVRYYAGPGFYEFFEKLAGLAQLFLPGSGMKQGLEDSARATDQIHAGNYGTAAVDLATATANTLLDLLPMGKVAIIGGMAGKTFPWAKLSTAEAMEKAGRSVDEIWRETGLARAADGKWRYEISDRGYRITPRAGYLDDEGYRVAPLFDHYNHAGLREAYPEFSNIISKIRINPKDLGKRGLFVTVR